MNSPRVFGERAWRRLGDIRGVSALDPARVRDAADRVPPAPAIACALVAWPVWAATCAIGGVGGAALLWALLPLAATAVAGWVAANRFPAGERVDALLGARGLTLTVATVMSLAATDRLVGLGSAYDINPDELTYLNIVGNTLTHQRISFYDSYFFLHPPVFFLLGAAVLGVIPHSHDVLDEVQVLRGISALMGAGTAGLSCVIAWDVLRPDRSLSRGTRLAIAALAGVLVAVDPFALRINSLGLIDSTAVFFVVAGIAVVVRWGQRGGWSFPHAAAAGLLFGAGLLTKEMTVFVGLGPLAVAAALRWVPWRFAASACATAAWTYLWYPYLTYASGHWGGFQYDKLHGFLRLSGQVQISGFNQAKGPSLAETAGRLLVNYAVSYLILAAALPCAVILLRQPWVQQRLAGLWGLCAVVLVAFLVLKGTLEEQFFYYLLVPSIICFTLAGTRVVRSEWLRRRMGWTVAGACAVLVVFGAFDLVAYGLVRTRQDVGWRDMVAHVRSTLPPGTPVGIAVGAPDVTSWAYLVNQTRLSGADPPPRLRITSWPDVETPVRWVIVSSRLVDDGLVNIPPATLHALRARGHVRYTVDDDTYGTLTLYRVPRTVGAGKAAAG
ncbi:MAG TPA: phospholipid carrier-dependent glycosyltransferase [Gaiellales bacterium]